MSSIEEAYKNLMNDDSFEDPAEVEMNEFSVPNDSTDKKRDKGRKSRKKSSVSADVVTYRPYVSVSRKDLFLLKWYCQSEKITLQSFMSDVMEDAIEKIKKDKKYVL